MSITGVTVVSDILRPDGRGQPGGVDRGTAWLHAALRRQIELASGHAPALLTNGSAPEITRWLSAARPPESAHEFWAAAYEEMPLAVVAEIAPVLAAALQTRFVVGYELPPCLVRFLDAHGIAHVDLRIHPVRFLDDLVFAVRASSPESQAAVASVSLTETEVAITAGLCEAMCRYVGDARIPAETLLVIGQRRFDSSQIVAGGFFDALQHGGAIAGIAAGYRGVILKPHPQDREHSLLTAAASVSAHVLGATDDNIYRLLAMPEIAGVLTVSSSTAYEAPFFGKTVHALAPLPIRLAWRGDPPATGTHYAVDDAVLSVDFWRAVLAPHMATTPCDGVRLAPKPNRLRIALDSFWNFQEIDTDRIPRGRAA